LLKRVANEQIVGGSLSPSQPTSKIPDRFSVSERGVNAAPIKRIDVSVTIVTWNSAAVIRRCLKALESATDGLRVEVHVVDNASTDVTCDLVAREFPEVKLLRGATNEGFARANNRSWPEARGRYWLLLNADTEVGPGSIKQLVDFADRHPRSGLVTARLQNPDGTPQHCAQRVPSVPLIAIEALRLHKLMSKNRRAGLLLGPYFSYEHPMRVGWTWATALLARREAVESVGPLSPAFFMYGEDLEWCLRMRRVGWEIWFCPEATVTHLSGHSALQRWDERNRQALVTEGCYRALAMHRGALRVRLLRAATAVARGIEVMLHPWGATRPRKS